MFLYYRKNHRLPWTLVELAGLKNAPRDPGVLIRSLNRQTGEYVGLAVDNGESFWSLATLRRTGRFGAWKNGLDLPTTRAKEFFAGWRRETRGGRRVWVRQDARQLSLQARESGR